VQVRSLLGTIFEKPATSRTKLQALELVRRKQQQRLKKRREQLERDALRIPSWDTTCYLDLETAPSAGGASGAPSGAAPGTAAEAAVPPADDAADGAPADAPAEQAAPARRRKKRTSAPASDSDAHTSEADPRGADELPRGADGLPNMGAELEPHDHTVTAADDERGGAEMRTFRRRCGGSFYCRMGASGDCTLPPLSSAAQPLATSISAPELRPTIPGSERRVRVAPMKVFGGAPRNHASHASHACMPSPAAARADDDAAHRRRVDVGDATHEQPRRRSGGGDGACGGGFESAYGGGGACGGVRSRMGSLAREPSIVDELAKQAGWSARSPPPEAKACAGAQRKEQRYARARVRPAF
jgi:hypothetical protein